MVYSLALLALKTVAENPVESFGAWLVKLNPVVLSVKTVAWSGEKILLALMVLAFSLFSNAF